MSQASTIYREQLGDEFATIKHHVLLKDCDVLHDLVLFVQLKKREKHSWRSVRNFHYYRNENINIKKLIKRQLTKLRERRLKMANHNLDKRN